jgi:LPS sulfotransferase NodH
LTGLAENDSIKVENLVWIFGTGRSGTTWLAAMMGEPSGVIGEPVRWMEDEEYRYRFWNEPLVGQLFGQFYTEVPRRQLNRVGFILTESMRKTWLHNIRHLVLDGAGIRFPEVAREGYLIIKEPNGSVGAPLLMEALPESRMVFLVRDPRDVAASALNRHGRGGIAHKKRSEDPRSIKAATASRADTRPDAFVRGQAQRYLRNLSQAKQAYDTHEGYKVLIRYEELRADTLGTLRHIHSTLDIPVADEDLVRAVEKYAWENIPGEHKGSGKDRRKAAPGSWREDLTPEQAKIVENVTAPLLKELYPDREMRV